MRTRKFLIFCMIAALSLVFTIPVLAQVPPKAGALMTEDAFTPISKGYDLIRAGKYEAAKYEFEAAAKADPMNPFALNNMAVIQEQEGNLNDAMANLKAATTNADKYLDKVVQTCFAGGGCMAVKPTREKGEKSSVAPIIQENIKKLEAKIAATGTKPPAGSPPPLVPAPPTK